MESGAPIPIVTVSIATAVSRQLGVVLTRLPPAALGQPNSAGGGLAALLVADRVQPPDPNRDRIDCDSGMFACVTHDLVLSYHSTFSAYDS